MRPGALSARGSRAIVFPTINNNGEAFTLRSASEPAFGTEALVVGAPEQEA